MDEIRIRTLCDAAATLDAAALAINLGQRKNLQGRKRLRRFKRHALFGQFTRRTLWDFWPIDFGLYVLLNPGANGMPLGWLEEGWRYGPVETLLQLMLELRDADRALFDAVLMELRGKLDGRSFTVLVARRAAHLAPNSMVPGLDLAPAGDLGRGTDRRSGTRTRR